MKHKTIHWFRKGLRLHDNPALLAACENSQTVWPVFILDPWFVKNACVGINRWIFLLQSLQSLDEHLKKLGGQLFVLKGDPKTVLKEKAEEWSITQISYEIDTEPYAVKRDSDINELCKSMDIEIIKKTSHTLYDAQDVITKNGGKAPGNYQRFLTVVSQLGPPTKPLPTLSVSEHLSNCNIACSKIDGENDYNFKVPTLDELEIGSDQSLILSGQSPPPKLLFPGGEKEALRRLECCLKKTNWICSFEKPKTEPNSLQPSTTVLSPYLKFGCLSARLFYWKIQDIYNQYKKHSQPPVSLHGQLLWREFFYTVGYDNGCHFNQMEGNAVCRQIPWDNNPQYLLAWKSGRTGYPFIDAIMTQLREEGWIHHLARHAVACFLTRGDLWVSWEEGQKVFEEWLLDADWFLNAGNWMWLSASAFFHQYYRVYSPIAFGKKTDKNGEYIKKYLPVLKKIPTEYIYEPWKAPLSVQKAAGCIIGVDYPKPIVDHDKVRPINIERMKKAYSDGKPPTKESPAKKKLSTDTNSVTKSKKQKKS